MSSQQTQATDSNLVRSDLIPDAALKSAAGDDLEHDSVARVVTQLVTQVETPANVALFGPWGSGKSSVYGMIEKRIRRDNKDVEIVRYDAWKFGGTQLQRNFLAHVATTLKIKRRKYLDHLTSGSETTRLRLGRFLWRNKGSLFIAVLIALACAGIWLFVSAHAAERVGTESLKAEYLRATPSAAIVFGAVIGGLLLSNQALASATEKRSRSPLQDADEFSAAFDGLVKYILRDRYVATKKRRLVVFIDELDRCDDKDVVATLTNLKTFLDHDDCVFIVAADREVLETALDESAQVKPLRENEPYYSTAGAFLDKIFQHQLNLPPVRPEALTSYAVGLADGQQGIWETLRADKRQYEDVIYSLVPAHVQSPRRVKVLMNNFVTNMRVIQARKLTYEDRVTQVAVLTVLQTEFPAVLRDLLHQPRLLDALMDNAPNPSPSLSRLVDLYQPNINDENDNTGEHHDEDDHDVASPAGTLLVGPDTPVKLLREARMRLNAFLHSYLGKIHAAEIAFPGPELIYLQQAAHADGLEDADLARALDFATDTDPEELAETFADASVSDKRAAIHFLVSRAQSNVIGPSRANLIETVCRIVEALSDLAETESVASFAASTVLAEARTGRWRDAATPGALILGLLDPTLSDPISTLGDLADPNTLAAEGFLDKLAPLMEHFASDSRAAQVHALFGAAYANHPEPTHTAFSTLSSEAAAHLWATQHPAIFAAIKALPDKQPEPATTSASPAASVAAGRAQPAAPEPDSAPHVETSIDRYTKLLEAIAARQSPCVLLGHEALLLALDEVSSIFYPPAREAAKDIMFSVIDDPDVCNAVALRAIKVCPTVDEHDWGQCLTTGRDNADADLVDDAVRQLLANLENDLPRLATLPTEVQALLKWTTSETADEATETVIDRLEMTSYADLDDPTQIRRDTCYRLLSDIDATGKVAPGAEAIGRIRDLTARAKEDDLDDKTLALMRSQVDKLSPADAQRLDEALAALDSADNDEFLALTRLRATVRTKAKLGPIKYSTFASKINDEAISTSLLDDWLATTPPLREVRLAIKRGAVTRAALATYAATRNVTDRSKLWLTLEQAHYTQPYLKSVGQYGVNDTVVDAFTQRILDADLSTQRQLVARLLQANFPDTNARTKATDLAIALLKTGIAGHGPQAADIALAISAPGPRQKPFLRAAFDTYTASHPKGIGKRTLERLDDANLLTKTRSGWPSRCAASCPTRSSSTRTAGASTPRPSSPPPRTNSAWPSQLAGPGSAGTTHQPSRSGPPSKPSSTTATTGRPKPKRNKQPAPGSRTATTAGADTQHSACSAP